MRRPRGKQNNSGQAKPAAPTIQQQVLVVQLRRTLLQLMPPLLIHLFVRRPRKQNKRADNKQPADDSSAGQRRIERRGEKLVDKGNDEDGEEGGDGGQHGAGEGDEDEEGAGEGWCCG